MNVWPFMLIDWCMSLFERTGRRIAVTELGSVPSDLGQTTYTAYDTEGRITQTWGATYPVAYDYDEFGRMIALHTWRDENGDPDTTQWLYDEASGLLIQKLYADNKGPSYTYTPNGQLATRTWARGIITDYTYDVAGNLTQIDYSDGSTPSVAFIYDRLGRQLSAITDGVVTNLYTYATLKAEASYTAFRGEQSKRKYGSAYLVMTTNGIIKFSQIPEVIEAAIGKFGETAVNMLNDPDQQKVANSVGILLGFAGIILFDSQIVGETGDDNIAVIGLRPELFGADSATVTMGVCTKATYGCAKVYLPDPANPNAPFSMRSWADDDGKANVYDTDGYAGIFELHGDDKATPTPNVNKGAVSLFKKREFSLIDS